MDLKKDNKIAHLKIIKNSHGQRKRKRKRIYGLEESKGTPHWKYVFYATGKQRKSYCSFQYNSLLRDAVMKI